MALQLHYFEQTGELLSLSTEEMLELQPYDAGTKLDAFLRMLKSTAIDDEISLLQRMTVLQDIPVSNNMETDQKLLHLINMFRDLNTCGIQGSVAPDAVHDPINKNVELRQRYDRLRSGRILLRNPNS